MSDEIYIWETGQGNVGHGSMTLHDGTHISWWPKVDKSKLSVKYHVASAVVDYLKTDTFQILYVEAETASSYDEDTKWEDKLADHTILIRNGILDIDAIKHWWMQFKDESKYHPIESNCCTVIYTALEIGGATKHVPFPQNVISMPSYLRDYAFKLQEATKGTK